MSDRLVGQCQLGPNEPRAALNLEFRLSPIRGKGGLEAHRHLGPEATRGIWNKIAKTKWAYSLVIMADTKAEESNSSENTHDIQTNEVKLKWFCIFIHK